MILKILCFSLIISLAFSQEIRVSKPGLNLQILVEQQKLKLRVGTDDGLFVGDVGINENVTDIKPCLGIENCLRIGSVRLHVTSDDPNSVNILWTTKDTSKVLTDCFALNKSELNWYGGPERWVQDWPIEKLVLDNFANVVQELNFSAIAEPYWLNSKGLYIFVDAKTPLFIDQNSWNKDHVCFSAKQEGPYINRTRILLQYTIAKLKNPREAHLHAVENFLGKPTGHPNFKMIERPVWSTWARYKRDVNDSISLIFANEIVDNGFPDGQFELDDDWEVCYGALVFRKPRFENIDNTVKVIKDMGFRFTLWVHPFVNIECEEYTKIGLENNYFVKNTSGGVLTQWWNSQTGTAQYLDFSQEEVRNWFTRRLRLLQTNHGIDSFKFDAGETSWGPQPPVLYGDIETSPNNIAVEYVKTCAEFGDLVEVRTGYNTQYLPTFVRMIDKDSVWGNNNGLYTLITTLLQMNMNGYTMVLPDMIGGNGYNEVPDAELFIRWLQANTFMPSIQFSFVPWDYKNVSGFDVVALSKKFVNLHQRYANEIIRAMDASIVSGHPVNGPVWWIDPTDAASHSIDTQFLLGEDVVVAPVIIQGATSRDVYLPAGTWIDGNTGKEYEGRQTLSNYSAPINVLPYFLRKLSKASELM